jgi:uncharacterized protein YndB with AHSA1/START domain
MSEFELRIERTFKASPEQVFDAWTSPEVMRRWIHCESDWSTPVAEVDLRVGGRVRVVMRRRDGVEPEMEGEYTAIERPHRLEMKWVFYDSPSNEQRIELTFTETAPGETTVVLLNTRISTDERRASQDEGWRGCLEQLGTMLASA